MDGLNHKIVRYKDGEEKALLEIIEQMTPLVKKYTNKIHFMEKEDAEQEFYLILVKCILKIDSGKSEGECVKYIERARINRYNYLCRTNLNKEIFASLEDLLETFVDKRNNQEIENVEIRSCLEKLKKENNKKWKILELFVYERLTDAEIARRIGVSRQYVNTERKKLLKQIWGNGKE